MAPSAIARTQQRVIMVCNTCGSEDVVVDAWAAWNVESQQWELAETFDAAFCNYCESESSISAKLAHGMPA